MSTSAPQSARDDAENMPPNHSSVFSASTLKASGDHVFNLSSQPQATHPALLEQELAKARADIKFLHSQSLRLSSELRSYQTSYPHHAPSVSSPSPFDELPPWMSKEAVISPLFTAYDVKLADLASVTSRQRAMLDAFAEQAALLVAENELLRDAQLKDVKAALGEGLGLNNGNGGGGAGGSSGVYSAFASASPLGPTAGDVEERFGLLMSENGLLAEQVAVLSTELERAQGEILHREQNIVNLTSGLGDAATSMKSLEDLVDQLRAEKGQADEQLLQKISNLEELHIAAQRAASQHSSTQSQLSDSSATVSELRADNAELSKECDSLAAQVGVATQRLNDLSGKVGAATLAGDHLAEKLRRTANELATTRHDAEGMLAVMSGMERQLSEFQSREEGVSQLSRECKTKVEDALLARDQANALCATLRREVAKLLEARKEDADNSAMLQEQLMDALREKMQDSIDKKDRDLHELTLTNAKLKGAAERHRREKTHAEDLLARLQRTLKEERDNQETKFADAKRKINEAEHRYESAEAQFKQTVLLERQQAQELEARDARILELQAQADRERDAARLETTSLKARVRECEDKVEAKRFEMDKLQLLIEEARSTTTHKMQEVVKRMEIDIDESKLALEVSRAGSRERESSIQQAIENHGKSMEKLRMEKDRAVEALDRRLAEERESVQRITHRNQELSTRVNMLAAEKSELSLIAAEAEGRVEELEISLGEVEGQVKELSSQLSANVLDQQQRVRNEGKLKAELSRLQMELQRASVAK